MKGNVILAWTLAALAAFQLCAADRPQVAADAAGDMVFADFEASDYGSWKAEGDAFGPGPARGTLPGQMAVSGFLGKGLVNSFYGGDKATGTLTSPEFTIQRRYIHFLIGGGGWEGKTCMNLLVDGKVACTATGPNIKPDGSEELAPSGWDVSDFSGRKARIEIVDRATGGWGHINVDQIVFSDRKPPAMAKLIPDASRQLTAERRWLWFPIRSAATQRRVQVVVDGKVERWFNAELADGEPGWWSPLEISQWKGKSVTIQVDRLPEDSAALKSLHQSDEWENLDQLYREPLRPQFHFSARRGWLNDPNGLVFYGGEYHLFFQHSPFSWHGGTKLWGHAVSKDLMHWQELDEALWADELGEMYSGSAVVDHQNSSSFRRDGRAPLVLIYTAAGSPFTQCIAWSTDGRTFSKYSGNPVVRNVSPGNRDPKVLWHEPTRNWVMAFYAGLPAPQRDNARGSALVQHTIQFYTSPNLRDWTPAGVTPGGVGNDHFLFECPDLFSLPLEGDAGPSKWIISAADAEYALGAFDGTKFTADGPKIGPGARGYYAAQTFSDEPTGRRIQIFWLQPPAPGMPFNQCMSVPMQLSLRRTAEGPRLARWPVKELEQLRHPLRVIGAEPLKPGDNPLAGLRAELVDVEAVIDPGEAKEIALDVRGTKIVYNAEKREVLCGGQRQSVPLVDGALHLRVLADRGVLELFAAQGMVYIPLPFMPKPEDISLSLTAAGGEARIRSVGIYEMARAWPQKPLSP